MLNLRQRICLLSSVAVTATFIVGAASAQGLRDARPPAEFPPSTFSGNQYVDSRGCVFVRAGIGGNVDWVPRVARDRSQLCGFQPTQVAGTTSSAPRPNVPNPLDTQVAGIAPRAPAASPAPTARPAATATPAPTPARAPVAAPAPQTPRMNLPTSTANAINPLTGRPVGAAQAARVPIASASPSPRVITAPAPTTQPRVMTRAQACEGLTGVQPQLVSQRTGQPIDCGGARPTQQVAAVTRPSVQQSTQSRYSRVQACADMASSGRSFVSASTGLPLRCGPQTQPVSSGALAQIRTDMSQTNRPYSNPLDAAPGSTFTRPVGPVFTRNGMVPYSNPLDSAPGSTTFTPRGSTTLASTCTSGTGQLAVRCGPQTQSPSGVGHVATVTRAQSSTSTTNIWGQSPPYSNPTNSYALPTPSAPEGYTSVWNDGRLNSQRGLPQGVQLRDPSGLAIRTGPQTQSPSGYSNTVRYAVAPATPAPAAAQQPAVTNRAVAPQPQRSDQINGHRYVQVGTYDARDTAQSIARSLRAQGLPMRVGVFNQNGRELRLVLAGPFSTDNQLQNALSTARGAGYSGAFTRR